jgi:hypothetical protein
VAPVTSLSGISAITWSIIDENNEAGGTKFNSTNEIILLTANTNLASYISQHEKISLYAFTNFVYTGSGITMLYENYSFGLYNYQIIIPQSIPVNTFIDVSEIDNLRNMDYRDVISFNVSTSQFTNKEFQVVSTFSDDKNIYFNINNSSNYSNAVNVGLNILYKNRNNPYKGYYNMNDYYMDFKILDTEYIFISGSTHNRTPDTFNTIGQWYTKIKLDKNIMWIDAWWKGTTVNYMYPNGTLPNLISDYLVDTKTFSWYNGNFNNDIFEAYWYNGYFNGGQWNGYNATTNSYQQPPANIVNPRKNTIFRQI